MHRCVLVDLDGTLVSMQLRRQVFPLMDRGVIDDWEMFYSISLHEEPVPRMMAALAAFDSGVLVMLLTARSERRRDVTERWLRKHDIRYESLLMRRSKSTLPSNASIKRALYDAHVAPQRHLYPVMAFDDVQEVVDMWCALGIPAARVAEHAS